MSNFQAKKKLQKELETLLENKPQLYATSVEDVDDAYQARLEWQWEVERVKGELLELEKES